MDNQKEMADAIAKAILLASDAPQGCWNTKTEGEVRADAEYLADAALEVRMKWLDEARHDQSVRLSCAQLGGGDVGNAQRLYEFVMNTKGN